jgi:hypothetical protein
MWPWYGEYAKANGLPDVIGEGIERLQASVERTTDASFPGEGPSPCFTGAEMDREGGRANDLFWNAAHAVDAYTNAHLACSTRDNLEYALGAARCLLNRVDREVQRNLNGILQGDLMERVIFNNEKTQCCINYIEKFLIRSK